MYSPRYFRESDQARLFGFIEQHRFGLLVSQSSTGPLANAEPLASHLPLLVDRASGPHGALVGHMARANPHWQMTDRNVLVVFSGPHAYISPTWYESENVVPTWNYVAVHVLRVSAPSAVHPAFRSSWFTDHRPRALTPAGQAL